MILNFWIHYEDWFQMMDIASLKPLGEDILFGVNSSIRNLGQLCLTVESEASEPFHIYTAASI